MRSAIKALGLAAAVALGLAAGPDAFAKSDKAKGKPANTERQAGQPQASDAVTAGATAGAVLAGILLSDEDKATIIRYFSDHPQPAKPLPPGIAKNLERGKPLPPGIARRGVPDELAARLSLPSGYSLETVGADVVLIREATRVVADILKGAF